MAEKRKAARSRTLLGGVIAFNNRASTMDCQVRNLSTGGAKVTFSNTATVPDQFDLQIARKERSFRARMNEYSHDVPVPLEWAKRLRDCEAEKAALRKRIAQLTESGGV